MKKQKKDELLNCLTHRVLIPTHNLNYIDLTDVFITYCVSI